MKRIISLVIVLVVLLSVASIAYADASYPYYTWRNRMQLQQQGVKNAQVGAIQRVLHQKGYGLAVDWNFGSSTTEKVKSFQANESLSADGIVGADTWEALQRHLSKTRRDANGFDYYKVSTSEYFAHGTDGTWWLLTDSGTFSVIR